MEHGCPWCWINSTVQTATRLVIRHSCFGIDKCLFYPDIDYFFALFGRSYPPWRLYSNSIDRYRALGCLYRC